MAFLKDSSWADHLVGKVVQRRNNGVINYKVIGGKVDDSLQAAYGFDRQFVVLYRLSSGSKSRPFGSTTTVTREDYAYKFKQVGTMLNSTP